MRIFKKHSDVLVVGNVRNVKRKQKSCPFPREDRCPHHAGFPFTDTATATRSWHTAPLTARFALALRLSLGLIVTHHFKQRPVSLEVCACFSHLAPCVEGHNPRSGHRLSRPVMVSVMRTSSRHRIPSIRAGTAAPGLGTRLGICL